MRGRPPSIREEDILDAARDVFREVGHATTTAKIAKRAGVSEGILFYRYKSKEALLAAVIQRETALPESLRAVMKTAGKRSISGNLKTIVETVLGAVSRAHPFLELALTSPTSGEIHKMLFAKARKPPPERIVELLAGYFEAEIRIGRARAIDTLTAARAIFGGCIDHMRSGRAATGDDKGKRAFVQGLVDVLLHGTTKPAPIQKTRVKFVRLTNREPVAEYLSKRSGTAPTIAASLRAPGRAGSASSSLAVRWPRLPKAGAEHTGKVERTGGDEDPGRQRKCPRRPEPVVARLG